MSKDQISRSSDPLALPQTFKPKAPPSAHRPVGSNLAPRFLNSTYYHHPSSSIGVLRSSGSTLVGRRSTSTSGTSAAPRSSTLLAPPSLWLHLSPHSQTLPQSSGILAPPWPLVTTAPPWSPGPSVSHGLSVHRTLPRYSPIKPSPLCVGLRTTLRLLPPLVPLWVIIILAGFWGSPAPPYWSPAPSALPWWSPAQSSPPWWSPALPSLSWWSPTLSSPPWWSHAPSAPSWWSPALSAPP